MDLKLIINEQTDLPKKRKNLEDEEKSGIHDKKHHKKHHKEHHEGVHEGTCEGTACAVDSNAAPPNCPPRAEIPPHSHEGTVWAVDPNAALPNRPPRAGIPPHSCEGTPKVRKQQSKGRWKQAEDDLLMTAVEKYGGITDLSLLEKEFKGTRNAKQIRERWVNHLSPDVKKRRFSEEEMKLIEEEVRNNGCKWADISRKLPDTSPLMVKNFYYNSFRKKVKSISENSKLLTLATVASENR